MSRGREYQQLIQRLEDLGMEPWQCSGLTWAPLLDELPLDNLTLAQRARKLKEQSLKDTNDPT